MLPFIHERGAGPSVVVLHGTPAAPQLFERWALPWTGRFRVLVVHRPGYGESRALSPRPLARASERIEEALLARGVTEAHFVGSSSGAYFAVDIARRVRVRARSLVAIGGFVDLAPAHRDGLRAFAAALRGGAELTAAIVESNLSPAARERLFAEGLALAQGCSSEALADELAEVAEAPSLEQALRDLAVPGLSLRGSLDVSMSREASEAVAAACSPGAYEELEGLGHAAMLEDPEGTALRVARLLGALEPASQSVVNQ